MLEELHSFHIPVMGVGHSADTPIRVAPLGITSVVSLVDDLLLEKLREFYSADHKLPFVKIARGEEDGRARRITAYLNMAKTLVSKKFEEIRELPFFVDNDKRKYFELLPDESPLKQDYLNFLKMPSGDGRDSAARNLEARMKPGAIDVNIMVKLDRVPHQRGQFLGDEFSDAKTALRGFANSRLHSAVIFSAGLNPKLFSYVCRFRDFYRDACGEIKKKIVLKVSDFRSAAVQTKFLAKRGLEVSEYRVESGLNCGGHAFPSRGQLLPLILKEFREKWHELTENIRPMIREFYEKMKWPFTESKGYHDPRLTVQGGIGTDGEVHRLKREFNVAGTGWGSPFLLVPEATHVDDPTRELLQKSTEADLHLSTFSPLGIPFNTVRGTRSEEWTRQRVEKGIPGSPCPKGFAVTNTEFTEKPICLASREYQKKKLEQIDGMDLSKAEKERLQKKVVEKMCICDHLGNGVLIKLGLTDESRTPPAICPGPNIAWFNRTYSIKEMVDHIYGRGPTLIPSRRPHMFAKELVMNVDYFETLIEGSNDSPRGHDEILEYKANLEKGMELCLAIAARIPFPNENLDSVRSAVEEQGPRLNNLWNGHLARREKSAFVVQIANRN
jgi:hypothetical protein